MPPPLPPAPANQLCFLPPITSCAAFHQLDPAPVPLEEPPL